jgi:peptidoglycan/xylan/chitin deacetylase (PgdA/CDA1 family)
MRNRVVRKGLILLYHRVAELPCDPQLLCVSPGHFAQHLEILARYWQPVQLMALTQGVQNRRLPNRGVAITFDDGYADNLYSAKPLLEQCNVPATVFVTTGCMGRDQEFWWDELERLLLQPGRLPAALRLSINGRLLEWDIGASASYDDQACSRNRGWNVLRPDDPTPRHAVYRSLGEMFVSLPEEARRQALNDLSGWASAPPAVRATHRAVSPDEVVRLADGGLVEIGAHTVTHALLSSLPATAQQSEIRSSKARLEEILGRAVASFAYPYGSRSHYTTQTIGFVREAGFACACSNYRDVVWRGSDPFQLPRVLVRDCDGDEFARQLHDVWSG